MSELSLSLSALSCPVVCGSIAVPLSEKTEQGATHSWCLYIRCPKNRDLSIIIEKVVFSLHPSFPHPNRIVRAPFEIVETGWGEFDVGVQIYFKDSSIPVIKFPSHPLRLYHEYHASSSSLTPPTIPVVMERYDEISFEDHLLNESFRSDLSRYIVSDTDNERLSYPSYQMMNKYLAFLTVKQDAEIESADCARYMEINEQILEKIAALRGKIGE